VQYQSRYWDFYAVGVSAALWVGAAALVADGRTSPAAAGR